MTTLKELSKLLNVSVSTVSKALNDSPDIGPATKQRVREVAELYNYKPNKMALGLKINQTKTIGVIIPDILNQFFAKVLYGIEKTASEKGYDTIVCISHETYLDEQKNIEVLTNGRVDGIIMSLSTETLDKNHVNHLKRIHSNKQPIVLFDRVSDKINCDKVVIDDQQSIYNATEFLIKQGKKNIAFVSNISHLAIGALRQKGYEKALKANQLNVEPRWVLNLFDQENTQERIKSFLEHETIDAIISADNTSGIMVVNIAKDLGFSIPKDIAVIGFGDEQTSNLSYPQMTYINQNAEDIGRETTTLLIQRLEEKNKDKINYKTIKMSTSLSEKSST